MSEKDKPKIEGEPVEEHKEKNGKSKEKYVIYGLIGIAGGWFFILSIQYILGPVVPSIDDLTNWSAHWFILSVSTVAAFIGGANFGAEGSNKFMSLISALVAGTLYIVASWVILFVVILVFANLFLL